MRIFFSFTIMLLTTVSTFGYGYQLNEAWVSREIGNPKIDRSWSVCVVTQKTVYVLDEKTNPPNEPKKKKIDLGVNLEKLVRKASKAELKTLVSRRAFIPFKISAGVGNEVKSFIVFQKLIQETKYRADDSTNQLVKVIEDHCPVPNRN